MNHLLLPPPPPKPKPLLPPTRFTSLSLHLDATTWELGFWTPSQPLVRNIALFLLKPNHASPPLMPAEWAKTALQLYLAGSLNFQSQFLESISITSHTILFNNKHFSLSLYSDSKLLRNQQFIHSWQVNATFSSWECCWIEDWELKSHLFFETSLPIHLQGVKFSNHRLLARHLAKEVIRFKLERSKKL